MVDLREALEDLQRLGLIAGTLDVHIEISQRMAGHLPPNARVIDLGSGGGIPALVAAVERPDTSWLLVERKSVRADALERQVRRLDLVARVQVDDRDAVDVAHDSSWRGLADAVTARGFAPPAATAEVAAALLRVGGVLVVTESDRTASSWDALDPRLGLMSETREHGVRAIRQTRMCPPELPRDRLRRLGS